VIFQGNGRRHFGFSKIRNFNGRSAVRGQYATVPNFIKIGQTVAEIWRFNGFFKMAAVRHLGFVGRRLGPPTATSCAARDILHCMVSSSTVDGCISVNIFSIRLNLLFC